MTFPSIIRFVRKCNCWSKLNTLFNFGNLLQFLNSKKDLSRKIQLSSLYFLFFQCQSQLKTLYAEGIEGCHMEFAAYNLLCAILHSNNKRDLLSLMSRSVESHFLSFVCFFILLIGASNIMKDWLACESVTDTFSKTWLLWY